MEEKNIKQIEEVEETEEVENKRSQFNIQQFMNDMRMLGEQVNNRELVKPTFHYGDGAVTNYLLWLCLAELMSLNDKLAEEE